MNVSQRVATFLVSAAAIMAIAYAAWWLVFHKPTEKVAGHTVTATAAVKKVTEEELGVVRLSEAAAQRLGVVIAPVQQKTVSRTRTYGGDVVIPAGRTILVAAPLGGTVQAPPGGLPVAGQTVKKGEAVFALLPLLSPEAATTFAAARADADGQVRNAQTQVEVTKLALTRAERLLRDGAVSKRMVEEAQAQHDVAMRTLEAAISRLEVLTKAVAGAATGRATPIIIEAPESGLLRNTTALPGQNVPAGGPLFEVVDLSQVWLRVPVFVGDLENIVATGTAQVGPLNAKPGTPSLSASPVSAPPTANSLAATVDLYYEIDNAERRWTPGQRVSVTVPLASSGESQTVPAAAIVYDVQGNTWVYTEIGLLAYKRQRALLRFVVGDDAVLASGPPPGTPVVVEGAVELFGTETGFSK